MQLIREPNLSRVDDIYAQLIAVHEGRTAEDSARINAKLILVLLNHVGDPEVIAEALDVASG